MAQSFTRHPSNQSVTGQSPYQLIGSALRTVSHQLKRPWVAYLTLFILQFKVIWGAWQYRDLTSGDTSYYFIEADRWYTNFLVNITYSPLYTAFYGTLLYFSPDPYVVTILHRLIIVFTVALLVLAVMRALLPPGLAWLTAAWWVILPINFDALYEVHLFVLIPVLTAWRLTAYRPNIWQRSIALALLFGTAILVRNELSVSTALLALIYLGWEIWLAKKNKAALPLLTYVVSYGLPLLLASLFCIFFYTRSYIQYPGLSVWAERKHQVNMCMVYANSYQERHTDWTKDPWNECQDLVERDFGEPMLSLSEMFRRNPAAIWEHLWWNTKLTPNGLQVLLFNATSGTRNPDFAPVKLGVSNVLIFSLAVIIIWILGLVLCYQQRGYWWNFWLKDRVLGWLAMFAVAAVAVLIIPTQRPRPSYLFTLSILMMALTGMSIFVMAHRWRIAKRLPGWAPLSMLVVLLVTPNYYADPTHRPPRFLLNHYRKLAPFQEIITQPDTVYLGKFPVDIVQNYLGHGEPKAVDENLLSQAPGSPAWAAFMNSKGINLFYMDDDLLSKFSIDPFDPSFLISMNSFGWKLIAFEEGADGRWLLFHRPSLLTRPVELAADNLTTTTIIFPSASTASTVWLGDNWYSMETLDDESFHWVNEDAEIIILPDTETPPELIAEIEPGPSLGSTSLTLVIDNEAGTEVGRVLVTGRQEITIPLPPLIPGQPNRFRLRADSQNLPVPNDPRLLNFRVFRLGWKN